MIKNGDLERINFIFMQKVKINIENFNKILDSLNISNYILFFDLAIENYDNIKQILDAKNIYYKIIKRNKRYDTVCAFLKKNDVTIIEDFLGYKEDFFITEYNVDVIDNLQNIIENPVNFVYKGFLNFTISFIVPENEIEIILISNSKDLKILIKNLYMTFDDKKVKIHSDSYKTEKTL